MPNIMKAVQFMIDTAMITHTDTTRSTEIVQTLIVLHLLVQHFTKQVLMYHHTHGLVILRNNLEQQVLLVVKHRGKQVIYT